MVNAYGLCHAQDRSVGVPLEGVHVNARLIDLAAEVSIVQYYANTSDKAIDVVYVFPLDSDAAVCDFQAEINGKVVVASVKEKQQARREYRRAVARGDGAFLLEEHKEDIFQISVGNIPPRTRVNVLITYLVELKVLEDGSTRFLLPTRVAPRYTPSSHEAIPYLTHWYKLYATHCCWERFFSEPAAYGAHVVVRRSDLRERPVERPAPYALSLSLEVVAASKITAIDSGTHCIEWLQTSDTTATVRFVHESEPLSGDLVLRIAQEKPHEPRAIVEVDKSSAAVMLTLVPQLEFDDVKAEFIFVVDRSGSMSGSKINDVKGALQLFLRSLPADCYFNIVGFGSTFSKLFTESVQYNDQTLAQATEHIAKLSADLGGTEILKPLAHIFAVPHKPLHARQVFVLTDGEVSNTEQVINAVQQSCLDLESKHSDLTRCFSIGVGSDVSHALVEGIARAGNGTAQFIVSGERMEPKVMKQLKDAMQPSINQVKVDWGVPTILPVDVPASGSSSSSSSSSSSGGGGIFSSLKTLGGLFGSSHSSADSSKKGHDAPSHQVPFKVPPIFSGHRFVVYAFMSSNSLPTTVTLTAQSPDGPLKLILPVEKHSGNLVHRLAARKMIRDFEEERSALHLQSKPDTRAYVVALGTKFSLASKFTSFIAIDERDNSLQVDDDYDYDEEDEEDEEAAAPFNSSAAAYRTRSSGGRGGGGGGGAMMRRSSVASTNCASAPGGMRLKSMKKKNVAAKPAPTIQSAAKYGAGSPRARLAAPSASALECALAIESESESESKGQIENDDLDFACEAQLTTIPTLQKEQEKTKHEKRKKADAKPKTSPPKPRIQSAMACDTSFAPAPPLVPSVCQVPVSSAMAVTPARKPEPSAASPQSLFTQLILVQKSDGSFVLDKLFDLAFAARSIAKSDIQQAKPADSSEATWATALAIIVFEVLLANFKDEWELAINKSRQWLKKQGRTADIDAARAFLQAKGVTNA